MAFFLVFLGLTMVMARPPSRSRSGILPSRAPSYFSVRILWWQVRLAVPARWIINPLCGRRRPAHKRYIHARDAQPYRDVPWSIQPKLLDTIAYLAVSHCKNPKPAEQLMRVPRPRLSRRPRSALDI